MIWVQTLPMHDLQNDSVTRMRAVPTSASAGRVGSNAPDGFLKPRSTKQLFPV
jgi:hypothetical protein